MFQTAEDYRKALELARELFTPRVEKGIAYLDEYHPDWIAHIDTQRLSMQSCARCVGGQLMGDYFYFHEEIKEQTGMSGADLGFDVSSSAALESIPDISSWDEYSLLEEIWVEKINERLEP